MLDKLALKTMPDWPANAKRPSPHPLFDPEWYRLSNPDIPAHLATFGHYLSEGWRKLKSPHPLFSAEYYFQQRRDVRNAGVEPLGHFVMQGWKERSNPHPLFDVAFYLSQATDLGGVDPLTHYVTVGWKLNFRPNRLFDPSWYLAQSPDVVEAGYEPLFHYVAWGWKENRWPSPGFDPIAHRQRFGLPDETNPLMDYIARNESLFRGDVKLGASSGTSAALTEEIAGYNFRELVIWSGMFDGRWYLERYPDVAKAEWDPLEHFVIHGAAEFRDPNPVFDGEYYANRHPDYHTVCASPFEHYLKVTRPSGREIGKDLYTRWRRRFDELRSEDFSAIDFHISCLGVPTLSIVHVFDKNACAIGATIIESWKKLLHRDWRAQICFADDVPYADRAAVSNLIIGLPNIYICDPHDIPEMDFVLVAFGATVLREHSSYMLLECATRLGADIVYCDHDHLSDGDRSEPVFKPEFSPEYLKSTNYIGPCVLLRGHTLRGSTLISKLATGVVGAIAEHVSGFERNKVGHVPHVLYHLAAPFSADVIPPPASEPDWPTAVIIIPTRNKIEFLKPCIESLLTNTDYPAHLWSILIVDNNSDESETLDYLREVSNGGSVSVVHYAKEFNFPKINNYGAAQSSGDILVFLNNDTKVISNAWLKELVRPNLEADVGAVGAKLLFEDGTIQHGGTVVGGASGMVEHLLSKLAPESVAATDFTREISAVTGACLAIRRHVFDEIGGFDPVLQVAFNDVALCLSCLRKGYRNIYVSKALFYHFESKSRGYDDTEDKVDKFYREAAYTRTMFKDYFKNDNYYNPNLSVQRSGELAFPPRVAKPWLKALADRPKKILMLSCVHDIGYGVPVVLQLQAELLRKSGWHVIVGGARGMREHAYPGCRRVYLSTPEKAASFAVENNVDCVVAHTPPFFSITRWLGPHIPVVFYDYGEPSPDFFAEPTAAYLRGVWREKRFAAPLATSILTISETIKGQSLNRDAVVCGLANSHLGVWSDAMASIRARVRAERNWADKFVVMNVCRFARTERSYKGLNKYIEIKTEFPYMYPELAERVTFVLAGNSSPDDVKEMQSFGLEVIPNVSNDELLALYAGADLYMNFSRWEGYNLGIGQALAMGLPVIASDIEAHREFPIFTSNSIQLLLARLHANVVLAQSGEMSRAAVVFDWQPKLEQFVAEVEKTLAAT